VQPLPLLFKPYTVVTLFLVALKGNRITGTVYLTAKRLILPLVNLVVMDSRH
jgi:hypothetical protein